MNYGDIYNSLASVYDPQVQQIQQQQAALPAQFDAQRTGLEQAKVNAFKGIDNAANSRGVYFSGFRPDQQATYTGATYLPAMAKVAAAQTQAQSQLQNALNQLNAQRSTQAQNLWQQELNRQEEARQFNAKLAASGGSSGRGGGGGSGGGVSAAQAKQQNLATVAQLLKSKAGRDNHVSQETWNAALAAWQNAGYSTKEFVDQFYSYVNGRYGGYNSAPKWG